MSDSTSHDEPLRVDADLMRRVAWGLLAGRGKAEIAAAEEIGIEDCRVVCAAPGMFAVLSVWANFLDRRATVGRRGLGRLTRWAVEHVFTHAPERLSRSEFWRLDRLSGVMLDYGFGIVFGWMLRHLDGVMGAGVRKDLGPFRQNLVDLLCWAVEVTLHDMLKEQFPEELLRAKDEVFRAAIATAEFHELNRSDGLQTMAEVMALLAGAEAAEISEVGVEADAAAPTDGSSRPETTPDTGEPSPAVPSTRPSKRPRSTRRSTRTASSPPDEGRAPHLGAGRWRKAGLRRPDDAALLPAAGPSGRLRPVTTPDRAEIAHRLGTLPPQARHGPIERTVPS